jgi:hypothetical protein
MAHSFKSSTGGKTFKVFAESSSSGAYTYNKKALASYCNRNKCPINVKVGSQSNRILFNNAFLLNANKSKCIRTLGYDNTELYINLISKLDLSGNLPIITDLSGQTHPVSIDASNNPLPPYLTYDIDPSGVLFGDTICGINNYVRFMVYDVSYNTHALVGAEEGTMPVTPERTPVTPTPVTPTPVTPLGDNGYSFFTLTDGTRKSLNIVGGLSQKSYNNDLGLNNIKFAAIGSNVTSILQDAFQNANNLVSIDIPSSVKIIGISSLSSSQTISSIHFTDDATTYNITLQLDFLWNTPSMKSIHLPDRVVIDTNAFDHSSIEIVYMKQITLDTLNAAATNSGHPQIAFSTNQSFYGKTGVTIQKIQAPTGDTTFALVDGTTQSIDISGQLNQQSYSNVPLNNIKSVSVGSNVTSIGQQSLQNTTRLTSVTLPASVISVGSDAFLGSGLTTVIFESTSNIESLGFKISNVPQLFYGKTVVISPTKTAVSSALNQAQRQLNLDITALDAANTAYDKANTEVLDSEHALLNAEIDYNIASHNLAQTNRFSFNYQTVYNEYLNASKKKEEANQRATTANNDLTKAQQTKTAAEQAKTQAQTRVQTLTDAQSWAV